MVYELCLILGPMFAGKSTYLINKVHELLCNGAHASEILLINHSRDTRYDTTNTNICTHDGNKYKAISTHNLQTIINSIINIPIGDTSTTTTNKYSHIKHILIDEGQFFDDLFIAIKTLILSEYGNNKKKNNTQDNQDKKYIYICGLDGDFKQEPFANSRILDLIPYTTQLIKLNARCYICNKTAPYTKRIINCNETILVGGADMYQPSCITHLF